MRKGFIIYFIGIILGLGFFYFSKDIPYGANIDFLLSREYLCTHSTKERRNVPEALKRRIYEQYGIKEKEKYVIDHRINLAIGGTNEPKNLWPQEKNEAKRKDLIENYLARQMCKGEISLKEAQKRILNWENVQIPFGTIGDNMAIYEDEKDE